MWGCILVCSFDKSNVLIQNYRTSQPYKPTLQKMMVDTKNLPLIHPIQAIQPYPTHNNLPLIYIDLPHQPPTHPSIQSIIIYQKST